MVRAVFAQRLSHQVRGLGSALSEAGSDVRAVGVEAWGELCGEAGLVRDGGGRVGVAEET